MTTLEEMMAAWRPAPNSNIAGVLRGVGVTESEEFKRIRDLPRRQLQDYTELLTQAYRTPHGQQSLRFEQAATFVELFDFGGALCILRVGGGKTLVSLLAGRVMEPYITGPGRTGITLLSVPANLVEKTLEVDIPAYSEHWQLPSRLEVVSYETVQTPNNANFLDNLQPELLVCDEAHFLRNRGTTRTTRYARYIRERAQAGRRVYVLLLSGSMTKKSIKDYWHLLMWALPNHPPLPRHWPLLEEWANALDANVPEERRVAPGALAQLCGPGENVREGFRRRLVETPGIITSSGTGFEEGEAEPGMELHEVDPGPVPAVISEAFRTLRTTHETPGGEEITDAVSLWRHAGSLAQGFYLRWVWPSGEPDYEWLNRRKAWKKWVRETLTHNRRNLDSERLVTLACERGEYAPEEYGRWLEVADRYGPDGPPTEAVWISDWFLERVRFFLSHHRSKKWLVWVRNPAMGERLGAYLDLPYFGGGDNRILQYRDSCVLSMRAHGTGKNLQRYAHNLFTSPPLGSTQWEQTMGRTHRSGQTADTVVYYVFLHCKEFLTGLDNSVREARYVQETTGEVQKLLQATWDVRHTLTEAEARGTYDPLWG